MRKKISVFLFAAILLSSAVFGIAWNANTPAVTEITADNLSATPTDSTIGIGLSNWEYVALDAINPSDIGTGTQFDCVSAKARNTIINKTALEMSESITIYAYLDQITNLSKDQGLYFRFSTGTTAFANMNTSYLAEPGLDFRVIQTAENQIGITSYRHYNVASPTATIEAPITGDLRTETKITVTKEAGGWRIYLNNQDAAFFPFGASDTFNTGGVPYPGDYHANGGKMFMMPIFTGAPAKVTVNAIVATPFNSADHTASDYVYTTPYASCEASGIKYLACTKCGYRTGADEVVPQKTHSESTVQVIEVNDDNVESLPGLINAVNFDNEHCCGRININLNSPATVVLQNLGAIKPMVINGPGADKLTLTSETTGYFIGISTQRFEINNVTFQGNSTVTVAANQRNGGLLFTNGSIGTINNCVFKDLFSEDWAPVFQVHNANLNINNCALINNKTNAVAGTIYTNTDATLSVNNCLFANNEANIYSIANVNGPSTFKNTTFFGNRSGTNEMINQIDGTRSVKYYNCTILNNTANAGAALAGIDATPGVEIFGSIIAGNNIAGTPSNLYNVADQAPTAANGYNIIGYTAGYMADDIFGTANPALSNVGGIGQAVKIAENSVAANKIPAGAYTGIPAIDTRNVPRPSGGLAEAGAEWWSTANNPTDTMIDIGAYEYDNRLDDYNCHGKAIPLFCEHDLDTYVQFAAAPSVFSAAKALTARLITFANSVSDKYFIDNNMGEGFHIINPDKTEVTPSSEPWETVLYKEKMALPTQNRQEAIVHYTKFLNLVDSILNSTFTVTKTVIGNIGGSITGATSLTYCNMPEQTYTVLPDTGYEIKSAWVKYVQASDWGSDQVPPVLGFKHVNIVNDIKATGIYTIPENKTCRDFTIEVEFAPINYLISVDAGANGTVNGFTGTDASGTKAYATSAEYVINANTDYAIASLTVGGVAVTEAANQTSYTLNHTVAGATTIAVTFKHVNHSWSLTTTLQAPTCIALGSGTYTCSVCSETKTDNIAMVAHTYSATYTEDLAATCTTAGSESRHCTTVGCTEKIDDRAIAALGHTGGNATCKTLAICTRCSQTYGELADHNWDTEYTEDLAATCTTAGSESLHCLTAGCTEISGSRAIAALGHTGGNATCRALAICTRCSQTYGELADHNWDTEYTEDLAAICTTAGSESFHCLTAGCTEISGSRAIAALGHTGGAATCQVLAICTRCTLPYGELGNHNWDTEYTQDLAPDCLTPGLKSYHCLTAGCEEISGQIEVPSLGTEHDAGAWIETTPGNCTQKAIESLKCTLCQTVLDTRETSIVPGAHDAGAWYQTAAPSCSAFGEEELQCTRCNTPVGGTRQVAKLAHTPGAAATCLANQKCTVCQEEIAAQLAHNYIAVVTAPTCIDDGYTTYTCENGCNDTYVDDVVPSLGSEHDAGEWVLTRAATCSQEGEETLKCTVCATSLGSTRAIEIDPLAHDAGDWIETLAPTCSAFGEEEFQCTLCNTPIGGTRQIAKIAHTPGAAATCLANQECTVCHEELAAQLNHNYIAGTPVPATCSAEGYTPYTCENGCNQTENRDAVAKLAHTPGAAATCLANQECTVCHEEIAAQLSHNYTAVVTAPTCTAQGFTTYTCQNGCSDTYVADYVAMIAHNLGNWVVTNPTCTVAGSRTRSCADCDYSETEVINATGHSFGEWQIVTAPTPETAGLAERFCANCGERETKEVFYVIISISTPRTTYELRNSVKVDVAIEHGDANIEILWTSSDEKVATVDANGVVTFHAKGTVVITATVKDSLASDTVTLEAYEILELSFLQKLLLLITNFIKMIKTFFGIA